MPTIEIDFESFKAITLRRADESVSEGDVVRDLLGLNSKPTDKLETTGAATEASTEVQDFWNSEGVQFPVGMELEHAFRDGRIAKAKIVRNGVMVDGKVYGGLSPAGVATAGYQLNGWRFWFVRNKRGRWVTADSLRE
ncbi:hypothetical protein [Sphingomonas sp. 28-63-12]|uniref:hypothetical protein n=1 Tax=Sphingomonas sp. 28-63-12 TaxID=1970434 RepID=UPI000BD5AFDA|nr:MAG: hypothetical protein B7Y47_10330 [Sphingomonas sp. 28-63-12]